MSGKTDTSGARFLLTQIVQYIPGAIIPALVGLATAAIFTRIFNSTEYGQYSLAIGVAGTCATVASQWVQQGTSRYLPGTSDRTAAELKRAIGAAILAVSVLTMVTMSVTSLALFGSVSSDWKVLLWPGVWTVVTTAVFNPMTTILQAEMRASLYTRYQVGTVILRFLLSLLFVLVIRASIASLLWSGVVGTALLIPLLWRSAEMPPVDQILRNAARLRTPIKEMMAYGFPMIGWFFTATLLNLGDRFVIQWAQGPAEVGIYSANYNMVTRGISLVTAPVLLAAHPFLMKAWSSGDEKQASRWLGIITNWFCMIGLVLIGCMVLFSRDIALWLLGPEFRSGHFVMPLVFAGELVWQLAMYTHKPLEFAKKTGLMFTLGMGASALNLVLNWWFVPRFGFGAAAVITLVCYAAYALVTAVLSQRYIKWSVSWRQLTFTGLTVVVVVIAERTIRPMLTSRYGYWVGLGAALLIALAMTLFVALNALKSIVPDRFVNRPGSHTAHK